MPTYQYACSACDERLEAFQTFSDAALTECPACGGRLRKVFSAVGVVFKGSGFYKNDSRESAKKGSGGKAGEPPAAPSGGDSSTGSDTSSSAARDKGSTGGDSSTSSTSSGASNAPAKKATSTPASTGSKSA